MMLLRWEKDKFLVGLNLMEGSISMCLSVQIRTFQLAVVVKNPPANAGDTGSIPGPARSLGVGNVNPLQYSCLENPMYGGAWRVHSTGSQRVLESLSK